jgi:hypothetical protein
VDLRENLSLPFFISIYKTFVTEIIILGVAGLTGPVVAPIPSKRKLLSALFIISSKYCPFVNVETKLSAITE